MKMFRISEDDLETVESALPALQEAMMASPEVINRKDTREHLSMLKRIVSDVRWSYGPPTNVERIEA
jgi:hypothetical protein